MNNRKIVVIWEFILHFPITKYGSTGFVAAQQEACEMFSSHFSTWSHKFNNKWALHLDNNKNASLATIKIEVMFAKNCMQNQFKVIQLV